MCGRNGIIKTKAGLPAKQAGSQWTDQQGRGNKGTEEAIYHSGQAAPLIFHMAMQIYSSQDLTQPLRTRGGANISLVQFPVTAYHLLISKFPLCCAKWPVVFTKALHAGVTR